MVTQHTAHQTAVVELKVGREALIVVLLRVGMVSVPSFSHHEDIPVMPYQLILCIHGLIPLVQELDIGLPGLGIDPDYGIQTESVNAHVHPLFGRCNRGLESPGVLAIVRLSVIQVRHAAIETGPVRSGLAKNNIRCLRIVQREGLAQGNYILTGFPAIFGAGRPGFIV